jgi:cell division protein FtsZ
MPRIDELPLPAQNELRARREQPQPEPADKPRLGLLQRLASVGLGRREEGTVPVEQQQAPRATATRPTERPQQTQRAPEQRAPEQRVPDPVAEYGRRPAAQRPAPQGLDLHGRPAATPSGSDEDHLEIPAFLRRQAK